MYIPTFSEVWRSLQAVRFFLLIVLGLITEKAMMGFLGLVPFCSCGAVVISGVVEGTASSSIGLPHLSVIYKE